ncbi:hypothetical protein ABB37_01230 [Leptomonas pyrrhocoris]|uniref:Uncharacterized protein n=1 Tax=Leptomonas pyrrhocoris TaxID=157538 RepID=A0A0M9G8C7_LEPPY|nr:hypothetical protein ABB37_01230 [Leptomonas pyrrhocoris]KPA84733.1 hypothetical protein ABB37_01230 [Leptomonas pyrrhocoris]|eukprot:XP_015663172.1 hypothetical protein ABB37_01230 [Leptomonas pyrrhocoris]
MPSLVEEAEAEFQRLRQEDNVHSVIRLHTSDYDFFTEEVQSIVPIHVIEARRQEKRRHGVVDASATPLDFLKSIGVDPSDTRDPTNGRSTLQIEPSSRAYYGDPEADAYRAYRTQMLHFAEDEQWLKEKTFAEGQTVYDRERLSYVERGREQPACGLTEPITGFKKAFFERQRENKRQPSVCGSAEPVTSSEHASFERNPQDTREQPERDPTATVAGYENVSFTRRRKSTKPRLTRRVGEHEMVEQTIRFIYL